MLDYIISIIIFVENEAKRTQNRKETVMEYIYISIHINVHLQLVKYTIFAILPKTGV